MNENKNKNVLVILSYVHEDNDLYVIPTERFNLEWNGYYTHNDKVKFFGEIKEQLQENYKDCLVQSSGGGIEKQVQSIYEFHAHDLY